MICPTIPVAFGCARISKTDDATQNLDAQLHILQEYGIRGRGNHIFTDKLAGSSMSRTAWHELMTPSPTQRHHRGRLEVWPETPILSKPAFS